MSYIKLSSFCIAILALLQLSTGCAPARPEAFHKPLVAAPPAPEPPSIPEPPALEPRSVVKDPPSVVAPIMESSSATRKAEMLAREADWHFQAGRQFYLAGDQESARKEFNRAIDLLLNAPDTPAYRMVLDDKLDALVQAVHRMDLAGLGAGDTGEPSFEKPPIEEIPELTFPIDPKLKDKVLEEVRATASQLPLEVTEPVLSYINYFSTERGRRMLIAGMKRAGRYRDMIRRILDEEGVPQELIFLAQAESGFLPRAMSRKKAAGMWQFISLRGKEYGLKQSADFDERFDFEKATRAAARHLRDLYERYGDWYLAMAAYNCGPATVDRAVERTGYADFWELRRRTVLPKETANYVPIILAMIIMAKNPHEYGLEEVDADPPLTFDLVEITAPTGLLLVADLAECPVSEIRELNPALLKTVAPEGWQLRVPKGTGEMVRNTLASIPEAMRKTWRAHRVAESDTLASIARRYRVTERAILAANEAALDELQPGDVLVIPTTGSAPQRAQTVKRAAPKKSAAPRAASANGSRTATASVKRKSASIAR
ncbi:MAG TPA: transglycosylase SLT domain-containing protein [Bryobacteraceae bacterium]|nr:transglycosylase SLT domain-containing protein [Bryobacteraceae bacterium]HOQ46548.1 transglycosylase SLT domain-containing protein [Bryobacteraceae bacterium]HPU73339.1 transglycosylase SLT domain-containing protein [Bryobacteraceae bacterium]